MQNLLKIFLVVLFLGTGVIVLAQEVTPPETPPGVTEAINLDEDIKPEDLGVGEPRLLPDSPFYFLKNFGRTIQETFTFNSVKKAELRLKFANEKLMEVKKTVQKTENAELIKKAAENYQQEAEKIKNQVEKIKEKAKESPQVDSFLNKFIHQQTLHEKLLQKLEDQVPPQAFEKIKEARERHLETFKDVMLKLEDREEKITEKLDEILEKQKGSQFKEFKNLEVLKNLEEKVPEEAKEAIQKAEENALKKLGGDLEKMDPQEQEKFKEYLEKISGDKTTHLEILENLKVKVKETLETPRVLELKERLEEGKVKIMEEIIAEKPLECPRWTPPASGFCKEGRVIIRRSAATGCPLPPECIVPGEKEIPEKPEMACITLWDPVCGVDGKTYSNSCFAKLAGVEVDHEGVCKEKEVACAGEGEKVNRNPLLGPTNQLCCPGLEEERVSKSYSVCKKIEEVIQPPTIAPECKEGETKKYQCPDGTLLNWCVCKDEKWVCVISPEAACPTTKQIPE